MATIKQIEDLLDKHNASLKNDIKKVQTTVDSVLSIQKEQIRTLESKVTEIEKREQPRAEIDLQKEVSKRKTKKYHPL